MSVCFPEGLGPRRDVATAKTRQGRNTQTFPGCTKSLISSLRPAPRRQRTASRLRVLVVPPNLRKGTRPKARPTTAQSLRFLVLLEPALTFGNTL